MDRYIGTKIILAEPMTEQTWRERKNPNASQSLPIRLGFHVIYEDGYESWSPAETFERAYRRVSEAELRMLSGVR